MGQSGGVTVCHESWCAMSHGVLVPRVMVPRAAGARAPLPLGEEARVPQGRSSQVSATPVTWPDCSMHGAPHGAREITKLDFFLTQSLSNTHFFALS